MLGRLLAGKSKHMQHDCMQLVVERVDKYISGCGVLCFVWRQHCVFLLSPSIMRTQLLSPLFHPSVAVFPGSSQSANSTALLAAVAATLDVPASRCLAIASSSDIINAAAATGMVAIAVPRKMAYAASYPRAAAKFEAFGPGYATFARLQSLMSAAVQ